MPTRRRTGPQPRNAERAGARSPSAAVTALPARGAGTTGATVVRLNRDADERGLAAFRSAGMRVASSADFRGEGLPADLDGADILVFERFGLAIVDADPGRVAKALAEGVASHSVVSHRAERIYRALFVCADESIVRDSLLGIRAGVRRARVRPARRGRRGV